jgi:hypothetical protein
VHGRVTGQRKKAIPTAGVHLSAEGREGEDTLSGGGVAGPGPNLARAGSVPPRPSLYFFVSFSFFCFLF